jgi:hypothetical protein
VALGKVLDRDCEAAARESEEESRELILNLRSLEEEVCNRRDAQQL